jgi:hypothetical protein
MKTITGFQVRKPRELVIGFIRHWYPMYDGVKVPENNVLRVMEIALSVMLNSRISGNTGGVIWRDARKQVEAALAIIPRGKDLLDEPGEAPVPGESGISQAVNAMCKVRHCKLAVATKILHKKRPGIIPIFDSKVAEHYSPHCSLNAKDCTWGDYVIALTRLVHKDMLSVASELRELRKAAKDNGTPLTGCRILNVLIWAVQSGNDSWLRNVGR